MAAGFPGQLSRLTGLTHGQEGANKLSREQSWPWAVHLHGYQHPPARARSAGGRRAQTQHSSAHGCGSGSTIPPWGSPASTASGGVRHPRSTGSSTALLLQHHGRVHRYLFLFLPVPQATPSGGSNGLKQCPSLVEKGKNQLLTQFDEDMVNSSGSWVSCSMPCSPLKYPLLSTCFVPQLLSTRPFHVPL